MSLTFVELIFFCYFHNILKWRVIKIPVCLSYNWTDPKWRKEYSETLVTYIINKGACNFLFQAVYSQWFDTAWFLTKLTTSVSWLILENELSRISQQKNRFQLKFTNLNLKTNQENITNSDTNRLVLKNTHSQLVPPLYWLITDLLWLS